MQTNT
jgi:hypothetical protein